MSDRVRLVTLSFLMLFVELALIRWAGSNVVYLSYFSNFVLLGSFLGIGVGFLRGRRSPNLWPWAPVALAGLVAFVRYVPVEIKSSGGEFIYFGTLQTSGPPRWVALTVIFVAVSIVMACIGQGVAQTFAKFDPLAAYKWDLVGSVLGILAFTALSFLRVPPLGWGITAALAFVVLLAPRLHAMGVVQLAAVVGLLVMLGIESFGAGASWSPYYKVVAKPSQQLSGALLIDVNGVPHQAYFPAHDSKGVRNPIYDLTYQTIENHPLDDVLVIGAGGGNDVSVALSRGAKHVDAVEIDPRLVDLGRSRHPDHPYSDPRVDVHVNDGRAFLEATDKKYDLVILALPDSLTLISGNSSLRLESYLFTKQAFEAARDHLKPDGVFSMYNYYRQGWLIDRYANTVSETFGRPACVMNLGATRDLAVIVDSRRSGVVDCRNGTVFQKTSDTPSPATDDWPFPYLRDRTLPSLYWQTILAVLAFSVVAVVAGLLPLERPLRAELRGMARFTDLFCMGAAFLLLETKSVVQFALLFGTTWFVNALVFLGVLLSVLAAVAVSRRVTFARPARLYAVLLAALVIAWFVPGSALLPLPLPIRFVAAVTLAFFPIFTANLVFTQRFKDVAASVSAFGMNLIGAMVGGILEYLALITGYRFLLVLVAVLYGLAFLTGRRHLGATGPAAEPVTNEPAAARAGVPAGT